MPDPVLPPLWRQGINYGISTARHLAQGLPRTPQAMLADRLALCDICPHRTADRRCAKCGCPVDAKAARAGESCPDGRWGPESADPPGGQLTTPNPGAFGLLDDAGRPASRLPRCSGRSVVLLLGPDAPDPGSLPGDVLAMGAGSAAGLSPLDLGLSLGTPEAGWGRPDWPLLPLGVAVGPWRAATRFPAGMEARGPVSLSLAVLALLGARRVLLLGGEGPGPDRASQTLEVFDGTPDGRYRAFPRIDPRVWLGA